MPIHIIFAIILIFTVYKTKVWREWNRYYNTILFFVLGDLMYMFLFEDKLLWRHCSILISEKQTNCIWMFLTYPCTTLLLLKFYERQKALSRKILIILFWVIVYVIVEVLLCKFRLIHYYHGWNFYYSALFDLFIILTLVLHHYKPLWAILETAIVAIISMYAFMGTISI